MSNRAAPPSVYCEDFALIPRAGHEGKPRVAFSRPVNLLSAAAAANAAQTPAPSAAAHVLVLNLDGQLYIRDLTGSASLQWNGKTVVEANLHHGDRVRLGKIEYEVFATRLAPSPANGEAATPSAQLVPTGGGGSRPVHGPVTLVGACEQAELRLLVPGAPQACAMILRLGAGYWLWNLDPASPCRVNGEAVVRAPLADGSLLTIGDEQYRFRVVSRETATALPAARPTDARANPAPPPGAPQKKSESIAAAKPAPAAAPPASPLAPTPETATPVPSPAAAEPDRAPMPAAAPLPQRTSAGDSALDDDADVFKQWGPLAFAVAAADRPELQPGGSRSGKNTAVATGAAAGPRRSFVFKLMVVLVLLVLLAAGAFVAWKYGRRVLHP